MDINKGWAGLLLASASLGLLVLSACAPLAPHGAPSAQWVPSPNFDERRPNWVIIHHTSDDNVEQALRTLTDPRRAVSAHYLIGRNGARYQLVDERARAWHAGQSQWGGDSDLNSSSLGIELDNNGEEPFPEAQIASLLELLRDIEQRYHLPAANFIGHADVAPRRKTDPSSYFPWQRLAEQGFGLWCDAPSPELPAAFDAVMALQAFGYDVADTKAAIQAFKRHFVPADPRPVLTDHDQGLLHCLVRLKASA